MSVIDMETPTSTPTWVLNNELKDLPRLPIPPLEETLKRFVEYIKPLVNEYEYRKTLTEVHNFLTGTGPFLDAQLRELSKITPTSWLEGFWDTSYLEYREATPLNVSPAFMLENDPKCDPKQPSHQLDRASRLLEANAIFTVMLRSGKLPVDKEVQNPICMTQYSKLLGAARIPVAGRDELIQCHDSRHVVVLYKRQYYSLDILDKNGNPIPCKLLKKALTQITLEADETYKATPPAQLPNISILTSQHRDKWASVYPQFQSLNEQNLNIINNAIILLVLDPHTPNSMDAAGIATLHNYGEDRWFDKSLQLIVYQNSITGVNMEHAGFDGQTLIRWLGDIHQIATTLSSDSSDDAGTHTLPSLNKLSWNLNEQLHVVISQATQSFEAICRTMDLHISTFKKFGKKRIVSLKISPDAFVQMAFHLAYFRTYGAYRSAYESCSMKRYYHGRTECIRSLTAPLANFIDITRCPPSTAEQQIAAAKSAFTAHTTRAKECQTGNGVDRHLWGMYQLALQLKQRLPGFTVPDLYSLPAWKRMRHDHLSTSNCGHDSLTFFGFGPTWSDGIGIGYIIKSNTIIAAVTSYDGTAHEFVKNLESVYDELINLFENNVPVRTISRSKL